MQEKYTKAELTTVEDETGELVTGVCKGPDCGWEPGCMRLYAEKRSSVEKEIKLCSTDDEIREGQLESIYKAELQHMKTEVAQREEDDDDDCPDFIRRFKKRRGGPSPKDDEDDTDNSFTRRFSNRMFGSGSTKTNGASASSFGAKDKKKATPDDSDTERVDKPIKRPKILTDAPDTAANPITNQVSKQARQRGDERNLVDLVMLEAQQLVNLVKEAASVMILTPAKVKTTLGKLEKRTNPKSIQALMWAPDIEQSDDWGTTVKILEAEDRSDLKIASAKIRNTRGKKGEGGSGGGRGGGSSAVCWRP